ncbi:hypothetical protein KAU32_00525 [bacterium]|nr:hypothetical protein [bacterium]
MSFESRNRHGSLWNDAQKLDKAIGDFPFHTTGKKEKDFEIGFSNTLMATKSLFENQIITQIDKTEKVTSVYCFGKNHRPDLTINKDGIAIEIKFVQEKSDSLKEAIGQGYLYRLRYGFVFLILIISDSRKKLYEDIENGEEKDLEDILKELATEMNIFTYIVPAFVIKKPGTRKCIKFFNQK